MEEALTLTVQKNTELRATRTKRTIYSTHIGLWAREDEIRPRTNTHTQKKKAGENH